MPVPLALSLALATLLAVSSGCAVTTPLVVPAPKTAKGSKTDNGIRLKTHVVQLSFGAPVVMPLYCPQAKCKFGGSVGADSFFGFGGSSLGNVLGSVNRSVVWSSDSGATFTVLPSAVAKEGLANSAVGPGLSYHDGPGVGTIGGATMNKTSHPSTAIGHGVTQWNVTSVTPSPGAGWWRSKGEPKWAIRRTVVGADISWQLPFDNICTFSDYSGKPVHVGGVWLKTVVVKTDCSKPPTGWGDAGGPGNIHLFESKDLREWTWRSLVAAGNATNGAEEGANENDICVLDDGSLLVVFRRDGGDGWPDHAHRSFMKVRSVNGESWSEPEALPAHVLSARPQLLKIPGGPLFLTGGRPHLMLWMSADGSGDDWSVSNTYNLAGEHNRKQTDSSLKFCSAFANGSSTWLESTCYNSLVQVADDPKTGQRRLLVCYDRMGTEGPVAPKQCQPEQVNTFCMQITVNEPRLKTDRHPGFTAGQSIRLKIDEAAGTCWETPLLAATQITAAKAMPPPIPAATTAAACKTACCAADKCVAWTFGDSCELFLERGVLAEAASATTSSAYRAFSVPPASDWEWSWDTVPLYSHSSNASGLYSPAVLANLTQGVYGKGIAALDWEVNYTATKSHHLRQSTTAQARAIVAANPSMKVFCYQQGLLAANYSDAESAAIQDPRKNGWWMHDLNGALHAWDTKNRPGMQYCEYGQRCARVLNSSVPEMRKWFVDSIAMPTLADPAVAGLFYDNSMQLGQPSQQWIAKGPAGADQALELQRASAELQRQIGEATLAQHPGKRTLLSVQNYLFSDNQPAVPGSTAGGNVGLITEQELVRTWRDIPWVRSRDSFV